MITIFTTTKPMKGQDKINQANAIGSWLVMPQGPQIIVFAEEKERHIFEEMGATVITTHRRNERGTPFLDSMFTLAETNARYPYIVYANADIILFDDIYRAVRIAVEAGHPEFLIVGQRIDIEWHSGMNFANPIWKHALRDYARRTGTLVAPTGKDYFIFAKPFMVRMANLLVGRLAWDTWLVREAHNMRLPLMDATPTIMALHVKHDYSHLAGGRTEYTMGPGCQWNHRISQQQQAKIAGHITDANLVIANGRLWDRKEYEVSQ